VSRRKIGRPRRSSKRAREISVVLEPRHFRTLSRVMRAASLRKRTEAIRWLIENTGLVCASPADPETEEPT